GALGDLPVLDGVDRRLVLVVDSRPGSAPDRQGELVVELGAGFLRGLLGVRNDLHAGRDPVLGLFDLVLDIGGVVDVAVDDSLAAHLSAFRLISVTFSRGAFPALVVSGTGSPRAA